MSDKDAQRLEKNKKARERYAKKRDIQINTCHICSKEATAGLCKYFSDRVGWCIECKEEHDKICIGLPNPWYNKCNKCKKPATFGIKDNKQWCNECYENKYTDY